MHVNVDVTPPHKSIHAGRKQGLIKKREAWEHEQNLTP